MLIIHIQTPTHRVIAASDIGEIKAAISLAKLTPDPIYSHVNADNPDRWAKVEKINNYKRLIRVV